MISVRIILELVSLIMGCLAPQWIDRYKSDHREADSLRNLLTYTARLGQTKALGLIWSVLLRGLVTINLGPRRPLMPKGSSAI